MAIVNLYKPVGWSPLQAMEALRGRRPDLSDEKMVYAGRLDPMAEGVLLVLTGEDRYAVKEYLGHDKTYRATFLPGFASDTYDALGLVQRGAGEVHPRTLKKEVLALQGRHTFPFPPFSAYKIRGKPLHWWARYGRLDEIDVPDKHMTVLEVRNIAIERDDAADMYHDIVERIDRIRGDFRQTEAKACWQEALGDVDALITVRATFTVTSGTYIRSLAHELGRRLGTGALLLHLKRTRVGPYEAKDAMKLTEGDRRML